MPRPFLFVATASGGASGVKLVRTTLEALLLLVGSAVTFVVTTITMDEVSDVFLLAASALVALVLVSAFNGLPVFKVLTERRSMALAALLAGGAAFSLAPLVLLAQRATDAPSGSESLFFSTAVWGACCALLAGRARPHGMLRPVGALIALLGTAGTLANWERPSSFSPFVKFPEQEAVMVAAGVLFALGASVLLRATRTLGARSATWLASAGALIVTVPLLVATHLPSGPTLVRLWPQLLILGAALAATQIGWTALSLRAGVARAGIVLFLVPLAITGLTWVERLTALRGPDPILWPAALSGGGITLAGCVLMGLVAPGWSRDGAVRDPRTSPVPGVLDVASLAAALLALGLSAVRLFTPALSATSVGTLANGERFAVTWQYAGWEAVAPWTGLAAALLVLVAALDRRLEGRERSAWTAPVIALVTSLLSWPLLLTPLHVWNRWIPAEIQQSYGTEYAHMALTVSGAGWRVAAAAATVLAASLVLVRLALTRPVHPAEDLL